MAACLCYQLPVADHSDCSEEAGMAGYFVASFMQSGNMVAFFCHHTNELSGSRRLRVFVVSLSVAEKSRSDCTDEAGMAGYFLVFLQRGNTVAFFHQRAATVNHLGRIHVTSKLRPINNQHSELWTSWTSAGSQARCDHVITTWHQLSRHQLSQPWDVSHAHMWLPSSVCYLSASIFCFCTTSACDFITTNGHKITSYVIHLTWQNRQMQIFCTFLVKTARKHIHTILTTQL